MSMTDNFTSDLFSQAQWSSCDPSMQSVLAAGALLMRGLALPRAETLWSALQHVLEAAPLRHMITPGGLRMSVAMSNCGHCGWISDRGGYRYAASDPHSGRPWPAMPATFRALATSAAALAGFERFEPDACLINCYAPGTRLSLHQDRDERDFAHPIVSVSLGLPATFLFGGLRRADATERIALQHGDVLAWGGPSRLHYHGVLPLKEGSHTMTGRFRFNLTFRRAT